MSVSEALRARVAACGGLEFVAVVGCTVLESGAALAAQLWRPPGSALGPALGSMSAPAPGSTLGSTPGPALGSTLGPVLGSTPGSTLGSTPGPAPGSLLVSYAVDVEDTSCAGAASSAIAEAASTEIARADFAPGSAFVLDALRAGSSVGRGQAGEDLLTAMFAAALPDAEYTRVSTSAHAGDAVCRLATRAGGTVTVLVESKNYSGPVPMRELDKFFADLGASPAAAGLFCVLSDARLPFRGEVAIERRHGKPCVLVTGVAAAGPALLRCACAVLVELCAADAAADTDALADLVAAAHEVLRGTHARARDLAAAARAAAEAAAAFEADAVALVEQISRLWRRRPDLQRGAGRREPAAGAAGEAAKSVRQAGLSRDGVLAVARRLADAGRLPTLGALAAAGVKAADITRHFGTKAGLDRCLRETMQEPA